MKQVDELIRGEISAVESIRQVLGKIKDADEKTALTSIMQDHVRAVDNLKVYAEPNFVAKADTSGPWGAFTKAFAGGASFFGDKAALSALKVGEQHGMEEYREAIKDGDINAKLRTLIQTELIPNQERHLKTINQYLQ